MGLTAQYLPDPKLQHTPPLGMQKSESQVTRPVPHPLLLPPPLPPLLPPPLPARRHLLSSVQT